MNSMVARYKAAAREFVASLNVANYTAAVTFPYAYGLAKTDSHALAVASVFAAIGIVALAHTIAFLAMEAGALIDGEKSTPPDVDR